MWKNCQYMSALEQLQNVKRMYNATKCGENCAKWLVDIGRREDVTVNLRYYLPFDDCGDIEIEILNAHKKVYSAEEYRHIALKYV